MTEFEKKVSRMAGCARRRLCNGTVRPLCYAPGAEYAMSDGRKAKHQDALICAVTWSEYKGPGRDEFIRVMDRGAFDDFDVYRGLPGGDAARAVGVRWMPGGGDEFHVIETRDKLEAL